jgi:signal transduction histidine kinase
LLILKKPFDNVEVRQLACALTEKWSLTRQVQLRQKDLEVAVANRTVELTTTNERLEKEIEERKLAEEKVKEQDRLKTEFVVNVSHELRTPLTIFKNTISNLQAGVSGKLNPEQHKNLEIADKEIDRLARIIGDFLDISKIEAGKINLECRQVCVQSLVNEVVKLLGTLADEKNMELRTSMCEVSLFVNVDRDRMIQVLSNLINNAIKFVPDCGGKITVRVNELDGEVGIAVEDNGPGIEMEDKSKVFDRFVQAAKHVGPGSHGTGLGLAISKELVELHGGRIEVTSEAGSGTTFTIYLPLARECTVV